MLKFFKRLFGKEKPTGYLVIETTTKECIGTYYCSADQALEQAHIEKIREFMESGSKEPMILNLKAIPVYKD